MEATAVPTAVEPMSNAFSSPTTAVIPSRTFSSAAVEVTPSKIFSSAAVEVTAVEPIIKSPAGTVKSPVTVKFLMPV